MTPAALVERLGRHPAAAAGIDLERGGEAALARWLLWCGIHATQPREDAAQRCFAELSEAGLATPDALATCDPERLAARLRAARHPRPAPAAARLRRLAAAVCRVGPLDALARDADGFEDLGTRLVRLAPGLGSGSVLRFLRPLRGRWPAAAETPLAQPARAAAACLGWIDAADESPGSLDTLLQEASEPVPRADVESALERLGRRACARGRARSCPLGDACPARAAAPRGQPSGHAPPA